MTHQRGIREFYLQLVFISLTHFSNLSSLNYVVKSCLATIFAIVVMVLYSGLICDQLVISGTNNVTGDINDLVLVSDETVIDEAKADLAETNRLYSEVIVCIFTLILLVWLMNREFEISYRLSYHCSKLSQRDRRKIQTLKNQADWLLHNIIPRYVVLKLME